MSLGIGRNDLRVTGVGSVKVANDVVLGASLGGEKLIAEGATSRAFVPINDSIEDSWFRLNFNDEDWMTANTGVGFELGTGLESLIQTDVSQQMFRTNSSIYTRIGFNVVDPAKIDALALRMKFDDGFVAYLNGSRVIFGKQSCKSPLGLFFT